MFSSGVIAHEGGEIVTPRIVFHYINYDHSITYPGGVMTYSAEPYNFLDNSGEYLATRIIKSGESLDEVPTPPVYNQQYFNGWYVVDLVRDQSSFNTTSRRFTGQISYTIPNNPTRQTFGQAITVSMGAEDATGIPLTWTMNGQTYTQYADQEGCAHVYLAPLYANFNYVNFYDFDRNLISRKLLVLDSNGFSSMLVSDMEATSPIETNHYFMGWSSEPYQSGNANPQTAANTIPLYKDGYKQTVYITLYGGTNYSATELLKIYYDDHSYSLASELLDEHLKFNYNTHDTHGDVNFYAEYENAHWLRFIAGESGWGALYVPADYLVGTAAATSLRTTTRTGYQFGGWYTGYQDGNGTIWYYEKVTDGSGSVLTTGGDKTLIAYDEDPDSDPSNNITVTNYQGDTSSIDYTSTGTVSSTGLQMTADSYLYAKWDSNDTATYKVIIWQQKVTDSANQANKTYDFVNAYTEHAPATSFKTLDASDEYLNREYYGFHLGHYDQNVYIDPQGTSVINVYYDRDVHTYLFRVPGTSGTQYTFATDNSEPQFGYINGQYVELVRRQTGATTEYFLTQYNGGTTEYTGTIYDSSGNTVTNPVYGTTYYRSYSWYRGVSNPLYWNSRTVYTYEWLVPVMVDEYYEDDTSGTFGNIGTDADPVYVPIQVSGYTSTTTYRDAYVQTSALTAGGQYLIVNSKTADNCYALGHNGNTVATDNVAVQTANGKTWIETSQVESTSVWTVTGSYYFQNGGYNLRRANNTLSITTDTTNRTWSWVQRDRPKVYVNLQTGVE